MKLKKFQSYLKKNKLNAAFLTLPDPTLTYLTQQDLSHAHLIVTPQKSILYISKLDKPPKGPWTIENIRSFNLNYNNIGINAKSCTISQLEFLKKHNKAMCTTDFSEFITSLRESKTDNELTNMKKACSITTSAFNALLKELPKKTLLTELDIALFLESYIKNRNAELAFPTIVANGKNAAIPHHKTSTKKLTKGFLLVDFGAKYNNYCSDMSRTLYLGVPSTQEEKMYALLKSSQQAAINAAKLNASFTLLTNIAKDALNPYAKYFTHSLGHGIGIEVHESPIFSNKTSKIEKNVPFTIEPGLYFPSKYGIRIEDTVVFTDSLQILTKAPKRLICIS